MTTSYLFKATFTKSGAATAPSPAPTIAVVSSADAILVAALTATTALANLPGTYIYSYSGADGLDLIGRFTTTDATMDQTTLDSYTPFELHEAITDIATVHGLGTGATAKTYTLTDGSDPIENATVWVSTDAAGSNIVANGITNTSGEVTFYLDSGTTYYIWRQKSGYTFTNPDTEVA